MNLHRFTSNPTGTAVALLGAAVSQMGAALAHPVAGTVLLVAFLASCTSPSGEWAPHADLILTNGSVVTVDSDFSIARAVAVKDGRIIAVGSDREVRAHVGRDTEVIDLDGRTVIPGLQDSHIHFVGLGRDIQQEADLTFAMSAEEILDALTELTERLNPAPGEWLIGNRWDQYKYPRMVTRWEIDSVAPGHPVRLNRVYRGVAVNTEALNRMGIFDDRPESWPDWWLEDPSDFTFEDRIYRELREITIDGRVRELEVPTGVFLGVRGSALVQTRTGTGGFESDVESVRAGVDEMLRLGVTSIVDPSSRGGYVMRVYQEAANRGYLKLKVPAVYEGTFSAASPEAIRERLGTLAINNLGDEYLRWRGTKFYSDGGAGTRSAWLSESFADWERFEGTRNLGYPVMRDTERRRAQYRAALDNGWDLHTHAAGDVAMRQAVDLYKEFIDEIRAERPDADLRWSLIHAYLPIEEGTRVVDEMAEYGIIASLNPVFQWQEGAAFAENLGEDRMARTQPFRSYIDAGVIVASGSDYYVTSHDPWIGIYALLTRIDQASGKVYGEDETIGLADALRTYTINGAYLTYEEDTKGSIEVGKAADLVVLDIEDLFELERDPDLLFGMGNRVLLTLVDGEVRYRHRASPF